MKLGALVRAKRQKKGIPLRVVAKAADCTPQNIFHIEHNNRKPTGRMIEAIFGLLSDPGDDLDAWYALAGRIPRDIEGRIRRGGASGFKKIRAALASSASTK